MKTKFICEISVLVENEFEQQQIYLEEFISLLEGLGDYVEISFISHVNIDCLINFVNMFNQKLKMLDSKIVLGYHYGNIKTYKLNNFDYLKEIGDDVFKKSFNKIYFIDTSKITCRIAKKNLEKNSPNSEITTVISYENEIFRLIDLNEFLKKVNTPRLIRTKSN